MIHFHVLNSRQERFFFFFRKKISSIESNWIHPHIECFEKHSCWSLWWSIWWTLRRQTDTAKWVTAEEVGEWRWKLLENAYTAPPNRWNVIGNGRTGDSYKNKRRFMKANAQSLLFEKTKKKAWKHDVHILQRVWGWDKRASSASPISACFLHLDHGDDTAEPPR